MQPKVTFWGKAIRPLLNARGEVGAQRAIPASGSQSATQDANPDWDSQSIDSHPSGESQPTTPRVQAEPESTPAVTPTPAEALKTDTGEPPTAVTDQSGADVPDELLPFHKHPRWQQRQKELTDAKARMTQLEADIATHQRMSEFYQLQLNERLTPEQARAQTAPTQPSSQARQDAAEQLPANVLPPNKWEHQGQMADYINHAAETRATKVAQAQLQDAYKSVILPQLQQIGKVFRALEQFVVKSQNKDFDEVTKDAIGELFTLDPKGNVLGVKNKALLNYIQGNEMPSRALYEYALSRRAPKAIAEAKKTQTKELLDGLDRKPKPTIAPASTGRAPSDDTLDWNTSKEEAEQKLAKRGIIQ